MPQQISGQDPKQDPKQNPAYLFDLGNLHYGEARFEQAAEAFRQAIGLKPDYAEAALNLGNVLKTLGQCDEAIAAYRQAIEIRPGYATAYYNLGVALRELGRADEAMAAWRQTIAINPNAAEAYGDLGVALKEQGRLDDAVAAFRQAIALQPRYANAHFNLGLALAAQGDNEAATAAWLQTVQIRPDLAEAQFHLGNALFLQGEFEQAAEAYRQAIAQKPDYAEAHLNLGNVFKAQTKFDEAITCFRQAIALHPNYTKAFSNLGVALLDQGKLTEAMAALRQAIAIDPQFAEAHSNLAVTLWQQTRLDEATAACREAIRLQPDFPRSFSNLLFCLNYDEKLSAEALFAAHREWGERFGRPQPAAHANDRTPERRLRIGYVSPDFRWHSVAFFLEKLFKEHDQQVVEVFCYSDVRRPDGVTDYLKGFAQHWVDGGTLSDDALEQRIRGDSIDILVDLAGHTANNRLWVFARKPAPVQATWLGYPNSTGVKEIDYRLVDAVTDPPGAADAVASETLLRLPGGFLCYGGVTGGPDPNDLPSLTAGAVTFGSFNNPTKISGATLDAWTALLERVPNGRLLLKGSSLADAETRKLLEARFAERGVAANRFALIPRKPGAQAHLSVYHQVDIALDPFPYNGTTTTCEALWMGVPVVTLSGDRHAGRVGASLLTQVDLPELIANSVAEYVDIAAALAADPARLTALRHSLRKRVAASPLCDGPAFARNMEAAYRTMWRHWCETGPKTP